MPTKRNRKIKNKHFLKKKKTIKSKMQGGGNEHIKYFDDDQYSNIIETYKSNIENNIFNSKKNYIGLKENTNYSIVKLDKIFFYYIYTTKDLIIIPQDEFKQFYNATTQLNEEVKKSFDKDISKYNIKANVEYNIMLSNDDLYKFTEQL